MVPLRVLVVGWWVDSTRDTPVMPVRMIVVRWRSE